MGRTTGEEDTNSLVIFQAILVLVCLLAANDWTVEWLWDAISRGIRYSGQFLLFPYRSCELAVFTVLAISELTCRRMLGRLWLLLLLRIVEATVNAPQRLGWLIDTQIQHVIPIATISKASEVLTLHVLQVAHTHASQIANKISIKLPRCSRSGRVRRVELLLLQRMCAIIVSGEGWSVDGGHCRIVMVHAVPASRYRRCRL